MIPFKIKLNPGQSIPREITALTGIAPHMVQGAPYFDHIADEVASRLEGRRFLKIPVSFG